MTLPERARSFAITAHGDQTYAGRFPFVYHLDRTAEICRKHKLGDFVEACCYLHDVYEDTDVVMIEIEAHFGRSIAEVISAVSVIGKDPDALTHSLYLTSKSMNARLTKVCDRIANLKQSIDGKNQKKLLRYITRHEKFCEYVIFGPEPLPEALKDEYVKCIEVAEAIIFNDRIKPI